MAINRFKLYVVNHIKVIFNLVLRKWITLAAIMAVVGFLYLHTNREQYLLSLASTDDNAFAPQETLINTVDQWPPVFKKMDADKVSDLKIIKKFNTEVPGVTGWVVEDKTREDSQALVYTVGDGDFAIIGGIVDAKGDNLSSAHFEKFVGVRSPREEASQNLLPAKDTIDSAALASIIETQPFVRFGNGAEELIVVVDVNCPYCTQYFNTIMANPELLGDFSFVFMPVGILSQDSVAKAGLFEGKSQEEAKQLLLDLFQGRAVEQVEQSALAASEKRTLLWQQAGLTGVPITISKFGKSSQKTSVGALNVAQIRSILAK